MYLITYLLTYIMYVFKNDTIAASLERVREEGNIGYDRFFWWSMHIRIANLPHFLRRQLGYRIRIRLSIGQLKRIWRSEIQMLVYRRKIKKYCWTWRRWMWRWSCELRATEFQIFRFRI